MIEKLLEKIPDFIWPIKYWYLMTEAWDIDQICKQIITISVFRALQALFVAEKSIVGNENDKRIIEEVSSFHLTYQHWYLMTEAWDIDQICKQTVTISVFWALEALFVDEKSIFVKENGKKMIGEDSSYHLTYQTLMSDTYFINKQGLKSCKDKNRECLFTNLIDYYRYK